MTEKNYKNPPECQKAFDLAIALSELTLKLAMTDYIPVAATPQLVYNRDPQQIVLDIATGLGRAAVAQDYLRFMTIAQGTAFRLETRLLLDAERNYLERAEVEAALKLCGELGEMLSSKIETLSARERTLRLNRQIRPINFQPEE